MRITYTDFVLRLLTRHGALPLFLVLLGLTVLVLRSSLKGSIHADAAGFVSLGVLAASISGALAIAPAASRTGKAWADLAYAAADRSPGGSFEAGSVTIEFAEKDSGLTLPDEANTIQLWYPRAAPSGQVGDDQPSIGCRQLDENVKLAPQNATYPVILFAPGLGGSPSGIKFLMRALASNGYVVIGIDDLARGPAPKHATEAEEDVRLRPFDFSSQEALLATMRRGAMRVQREAAKALQGLNRFQACVEQSATLRGRMDLSRVGFVGYSFGGATAAETSFLDKRIAAVVNLDGSQFGRAAEEPVNVPYMMLHSDFSREVLFNPNSSRHFEYMLDQRDLRLAEAQSKRPGSYLFAVSGSFHDSFADPVPGPQALIKWLLLDPGRAQTIVHDYVIGFLNAHLKGDGGGFMPAENPDYPEVRLLISHG